MPWGGWAMFKGSEGNAHGLHCQTGLGVAHQLVFEAGTTNARPATRLGELAHAGPPPHTDRVAS
jgi:hypothetical protein